MGKSKREKRTLDDANESLGAVKSPKTKANSLKLPKSNEETTKSSSQKPQLKIVRNNMGSIIIIFFSILFDLVHLIWLPKSQFIKFFSFI